MKKRVLLINPPYPFAEYPSPPFGLMSLAAYVIEKGHDVMIEDCIVNPYSADRVRAIIHDFRPDIIGATGVTMNIKKSLSILEDCRGAAPGVPLVLGGPHATFDADDILGRYSFVDFIVRGEGEITFTGLLDRLENGDGLSGVQGLSYRDGGRVVHNGPRPLIEDINILPLPARHLVELSKYRALGLTVNMVTSRGCPHNCVFCVGSRMVGKRVRYFDVKRVVDEFEFLAGLGFSQVNVVDDLFTSNKKRCIAICDEIVRRGIDQPWTAFARVDTVSPDLLARMKEAGCRHICFGIESGNQEILDRIKKKTTLEKCRSAVRMCDEAGIRVMTAYILGLPGETPETVEDTLRFSRELAPCPGYHILAPFPGTEVREKRDEYGLRILTDDWDLYDANRSVCESDLLSAEEVDRVVMDFDAGMDRMIKDIVARYDRGDAVTPEETEMVKGMRILIFNDALIRNGFVDRFPGVPAGGGESLLQGFADFISRHTDYSCCEATCQVKRLIDTGCIVPVSEGGAIRFRWA